jgi:hypothetical protein
VSQLRRPQDTLSSPLEGNAVPVLSGTAQGALRRPFCGQFTTNRHKLAFLALPTGAHSLCNDSNLEPSPQTANRR